MIKLALTFIFIAFHVNAANVCNEEKSISTIKQTTDELWLNGGCQEYNQYFIPKELSRTLSATELNEIVAVFNEASTDPNNKDQDQKMKEIIQKRFDEISKGCRYGISKKSLKPLYDTFEAYIAKDVSADELKKYVDILNDVKNPDYASKSEATKKLVGEMKYQATVKELMNTHDHHDVKKVALSQNEDDIKKLTSNPNIIFETCDSNDLTIKENTDHDSCGVCAGGFKKQFKDNEYKLDEAWKKSNPDYLKFKTCIETALKEGCDISSSEIKSSASLYDNTMKEKNKNGKPNENYCGPLDFKCLSKLRAETTLIDLKEIVSGSGANEALKNSAVAALESSKLDYLGANCNGSSGPCPWNVGKRVENPDYKKEDFDDFKYVKVNVFFKNTPTKPSKITKNIRLLMNCKQVKFQCANPTDALAGELKPGESSNLASNKKGWKLAPGLSPNGCPKE